MLKHRTFRVVWVRPGTGTGISPAEKPDHEIRYEGRAVTIKPPASGSLNSAFSNWIGHCDS